MPPIRQDSRHVVCLEEGYTPQLAYHHPLAEALGCRLEVKDEGKHYAGYGGNPTLSFKDRGMAMTVSMARALGVKKLAVPTQGNAGDALARYAVAAGLEAVVVMSPETDLPVLGNVAALAALHPDQLHLELVPGTIIDCGQRIKDHYLPQGYFSVATFQEPGWRTEGKKTLGLEMAEPRGERLAQRRWELPQVIVYPTGGGTGVVGMAKAFDELEALGLVGPERPRMICVQSDQTCPLTRAFETGEPDITPLPPGQTVATGLNVARNVGHINVLQDRARHRRLCPERFRRGDSPDDTRGVATAPVCLEPRRRGHPGRLARADRPQAGAARRPCRTGQYRQRGEVPADNPRLPRRRLVRTRSSSGRDMLPESARRAVAQQPGLNSWFVRFTLPLDADLWCRARKLAKPLQVTQ